MFSAQNTYLLGELANGKQEKLQNIVITDEQLSAVEKALQGRSFSIDAYAGTGKTFTLEQIVKNLSAQGKRVLYLVFNKAMKEEAERRMGGYCKTYTFHGFCLMMCKQLDLLPNVRNLGNLRIFDLRKIFPDYSVDDLLFLVTLFNVWLVFGGDLKRALANMEGSYLFEKVDTNRVAEDIEKICSAIEAGWIVCPFDYLIYAYLKYLRACKATLSFDCLLCDEAQDVNPLLVQFILCFLEDKNKQIILAGDANQNIYGFRKSCNILDLFDEKAYLTFSFRFSETVAEYGNSVLAYKEKPLMKASESKDCVNDFAYISLSNASLIKKAFEYYNDQDERGLVFCRDFKEIIKILVTTVYSSNPELIAHDLKEFVDIELLSLCSLSNEKLEELRSMNSFGGLNPLHERITALSIIRRLDVCNEELLGFIRKLLEKSYDDKIYFSSVHSAKGLEFDYVYLLDVCFFDEQYTEEQLNYLYVAYTRCSKGLTFDVNSRFEYNKLVEKLEAKRKEQKNEGSV